MQPGSECRVASEASDFFINLQKALPRKIFRLRTVPEHPQAEREHPPVMLFIQFLKCYRVTSCGCSGKLQVRRWLGSFAGHGHCQRVCYVGHDLTACDAMTLNPVA